MACFLSPLISSTERIVSALTRWRYGAMSRTFLFLMIESKYCYAGIKRVGYDADERPFFGMCFVLFAQRRVQKRSACIDKVVAFSSPALLE